MSDRMTPEPENWYNTPDPEQSGRWYGSGTSQKQMPVIRAYRYEPTDDQQKSYRRMKIISLSLCAALVCVAVAMALMNGSLLRRLYEVRTAERVYNYDPELFEDFGGYWDEPYEDFRDYFANYYQSSDQIDMPTAPTGTGVTLKLQPQKGEDLALQEIYDRVSPAVVGITTYLDGREYSWGTGVVFDSTGYVVTNTHILQGCDGADVIFPSGETLQAKLVGADTISDIAVLYIEGGEDLPWAEFGQSATLRVGDAAAAIGNPLGQEYTNTMTNGIISAIDRNITYDGHTMTLLQTNAALNEGNSGGPLVNAKGQVIGITNMKIMSSYTSTVEGIGFAIPSAVVKEITDQLIALGYVPGEPTIGIVAGPVSAEARRLYDLPNGVYVTEVSQGSDALEKGLQVGDVITAVNGQRVTTVAQVNAIKEKLAVGDSLTLTVYRDGETFDMDILLVDKGDIR